ncbi:hypothetical protein SPRG_15906 [Saprolegnia parasitica CBS 223.65]|uniref:Uncharacterized protein n=1 Tax=Saprolegnia parasitica (strain CBS 223.65) TaxID=695850 RepID=A0A067BVY2_SAPPC|nr:hypothetical protein SPRG_15906 [Saprolegnia parasitica CBS 223.65]KDO18737.1 hypothetical protein SPRG_15906 [Saprolegnia parasitica CBS 223.65]|eukprot:XP_012210563.1 hypothetical protein SPRG_15906 [Saprolegnia parasitica CBS 223.65]
MRNCSTLSTIELSYDLSLLPAFLPMPLPRHLHRLRLFVSDEPYHPKSGWFKITALPVRSVAHFVATAIDGSALTHLSLDKLRRLTHLELLNVQSALGSLRLQEQPVDTCDMFGESDY